MYLAVLGNHPKLSLAELERTQGTAELHSDSTAIFTGEPSRNLGGSSKLGQVVKRLPGAEFEDVMEYLRDQFPADVELSKGKTSIGISVYGQNIKSYKRYIFSYKKHLRSLGYKPRIVLDESQQLTSAQVLHNNLHLKGCEILVSFSPEEAIIAQNIWVQDIDSYSKRDMERPKRDMNVGMLPPKLAQIMINLAGGDYIYDPFCGSGVILQEALLMQKRASGSDISPKMVDASKQNLNWLSRNYDVSPPDALRTQDARNIELPGDLDSIVSEIYLGPVIKKQPSAKELEKLGDEASELIYNSLKSWQPQLETGTHICLAVPAWKQSGSDYSYLPPIVSGIDDIGELGYNQVRLSQVKANELTYRRPDQNVGRRLILLEKV